MFRMTSTATQSRSVTACFKDGAHSFRLPEGETLGDLAGRIEALGARHAGSPIAIQVHFETNDEMPASSRSQH